MEGGGSREEAWLSQAWMEAPSTESSLGAGEASGGQEGWEHRTSAAGEIHPCGGRAGGSRGLLPRPAHKPSRRPAVTCGESPLHQGHAVAAAQ